MLIKTKLKGGRKTLFVRVKFCSLKSRSRNTLLRIEVTTGWGGSASLSSLWQKREAFYRKRWIVCLWQPVNNCQIVFHLSHKPWGSLNCALYQPISCSSRTGGETLSSLLGCWHTWEKKTIRCFPDVDSLNGTVDKCLKRLCLKNCLKISTKDLD